MLTVENSRFPVLTAADVQRLFCGALFVNQRDELNWPRDFQNSAPLVLGHRAGLDQRRRMTPVHWIIQENEGDSTGVRRMVQALESDGHVPHLVWLNKSLDVPLIPNLPDDAPIVCHGQGFVTRAPHPPRLKAGLFFDPETFRWLAFRSGWGEAILFLRWPRHGTLGCARLSQKRSNSICPL